MEINERKKDMVLKVEVLSNDVRLERLKQAHKVSQSLQNMTSTFTGSFETNLCKIEVSYLQ